MKQSFTIKILSLVVIILVAILITPYFVTRTSTAQQTDMPPGMIMKAFYIGPLPTSNMNMNSSDMAGLLASTTALIPTVHFTIVRDTLDGWDLHIVTTNFTWTPQNINQAPIPDEGHAHLYIDGNLTVLLAPWYHINGDVLPPGKHTITVSLNANDHSVFNVDGQNVEESQTIEVSPI